MHKVYYFTSVGFTCGTDSKRALIWWLYYKKLIISQQIYIENNQHVSYLWYKALYDVLNDDW